MVAVAAVTTALASFLMLGRAPIDDRYLNLLNGIMSLMIAGLIAHRLCSGTASGVRRAGWVVAFIALDALAVAQGYEGRTEGIERAFHLEDFDDVALLVALPLGIFVAARAEGIGRSALLFLAAGFLTQAVSTGVDLLDDWFSRSSGFSTETTALFVDFTEFVFLQLYFIGLALFVASKLEGPTRSPYWAGMFRHWRIVLPAELRYRFWRMANSGRSFADFYAHRIDRRLARGFRHATLGRNDHTQSNPLRHRSGHVELPPWERGRGTFDFIKTFGLQPTQRCVDYGCGSLRIGMHLMQALDTGNYWGVDITPRFYEAGLTLIDADLISAKRPRLDVISDGVLRQIREWQPDLVVSVSVLMHVPPAEVAEFLRRIIDLLSGDARALILFDRTDRNRRIGSMSWSYSEGFLCDHVLEIDPSLNVSFRHFEPVGRFGGLKVTRLAMSIAHPRPHVR